MPLSMTGFGEAHRQQDGLAISVELRTINSRYLKITTRTSDGYGSLEPLIESLLRDRIHRGTLQVNVKVDRARSADDYRLDAQVVEHYRQQIEAIYRQWGTPQPVLIESLLALPGVVDEDSAGQDNAAEHWPVIQETLEEAARNLERMRAEEGRAMTADLRNNGRDVTACLEVIQQRAPMVAEGYRIRLEERLRKILAEYDLKFDPADVIKEVGLFAERSDISEEIVRLRSHLDQFETLLNSKESAGRKLEFLTQEMFREINTIGSKANDVEISRQVIEVKAAIERIREMIQNIE